MRVLQCSSAEKTKGKAEELFPNSMASSAQCQKPTTTTEICQPKTHHTSLGHKISEMTNKAFKGHHPRHGSTNQPQPHTSSKTETHCHTQTQTQLRKDDGVAKTEITLYVVQAHITQTNTDHPPYVRGSGTTTTCFGNHTKKNREHHSNNKKDRNIFRRIKDGIPRHNSDSDSSSESDSDNENCRSRKNR